jgi:hypothetical protein
MESEGEENCPRWPSGAGGFSLWATMHGECLPLETKPMKSINTIPNAPHLVGIQTVRDLFCERSGNSCAARNTVSEWIKRRGIEAHGANPKQRIFDRANVIAALDADYPAEPKFITVEDAFLIAGIPYPNARNKIAP